jgi:quercetin dioxygenase-like cupin family protein
MKIDAFAFNTTNWAQVEKTAHRGETGFAYWQTRYFGEKSNQIRVRIVEYSEGYLADHWCKKGHILFCLEGELETTLEDGRKFILTPGTSYQVGDDAEAHQSYSKTGAKLFIVD